MCQSRTITGIVSDEDSQPLVGVNIIVKATSSGATTDANGVYSIEVPGSDAELVFSSIGFTAYTMRVGERSVLDVKMTPSSTLLDELIVVGYGVQQKKDVVGSISSADGKTIHATPAANLENLLQGRLSGVNVIAQGEPGAGATVTIRGTSSFAGSSQPLYVVDDVPTFDISTLNPYDVVAVTALKDAGAASIYGSRAANGVILITTRHGKEGAVKISYNGYYGVQLPARQPIKLLDAQGFADLTWLAYNNAATMHPNQGIRPPDWLYGSGVKPVIPDYLNPPGAFVPNVDESSYDRAYNPITRTNPVGTNWYDEITHTAPIQNHDLAVSGGNESAKYMLGMNYFDQEGTIIYTGTQRYSFRINSSFVVHKKFRIGENLSTTYSSTTPIGPSQYYTGYRQVVNSLLDTYLTPVIAPIYDVGGNYASVTPFQPILNPVATLFYNSNSRNFTARTFGNLYLEADIVNDLTFRTSFGGSFQYGDTRSLLPDEALSGTGQSSRFDERSHYEGDWNWQNLLTYSRTFRRHSLRAVAGIEAIKTNIGRWISGSRENYLFNDVSRATLGIGNVITQTNNGDAFTPATLLSLFTRVDYQFSERYLMSVTLRRDGSSKFQHHRYGTFPALTLGWRIGNEKFLANSSFINELKLRVGYGIMGDQMNAAPSNAYTTYTNVPGSSYYDITGTNNAIAIGTAKATAGNPDGQWQQNTTLNAGVDFSLFTNKLSGTVDVYRKTTDKLLFAAERAATNGSAQAPVMNVGKMLNTGVDVSLGYTTGDKLTFDGTVTFTHYRNEVIKIADNVSHFELPLNDVTRIQEGQPIGSFYGYKVQGLWQSAEEIGQANALDGNTKTEFQLAAAPGRFRYRDMNGDGKITADDRTFIGNPNPDFTYGIALNFTYANFDLAIFFYGVQGNDIYYYVKQNIDFFNDNTTASQDVLYRSWTPDRRDTSVPIAESEINFSNHGVPNSYSVINGSYLRVRNIQLGYSLPQELLSNIGVRRVRVYLQAANAFTWAASPINEQEIAISSTGAGVGAANYPQSRQFIAGLQFEL